MSPPPGPRSSFFAELQRRHVVRVAAMYGVAAWIIIEVTATTFPLLHLPEWWASVVVMLALLGFPVTVVLAWIFDLTPEGIRRTDAVGQPPIPIRMAGIRGAVVFIFPVILLLTIASWFGAGSDPARVAVASDTAKSIAVLPFANLSADPENAYFASGIHDEILTQLSRVAGLRVLSRTSVLGYAGSARRISDIAEELGVATVLEGSVQRDQSRVRVNVQLVNARTNEQIWSETYDRELTDVFVIQSEIAEKIAAALQVRLTERQRAQLAQAPTKDAEAYTFYLRAQDYYRRPDAEQGNLENAVLLYEEAIRRDPGFALAHAKLADAHGALYWFGYDPRPERLGWQMRAAEAAHRLAPDLPEAHEALGMYYYRARDYERALAEFETARAGLPGDPYLAARLGYVYRRQGRWPEAIQELETAASLNPRDADLHRDVAQTYHASARFAEADAAYRRSVALAPDYFRAAIRRGQLFIDWRGTSDTLRGSLGSLPRGRESEPSVAYARWYLAMLDRDFAGAARTIAEQPNAVLSSQEYYLPRPLLVGLAHARAGDRARALPALDSARLVLEAAVREVPSDHRRHLAFGRALAELGRREEAVAAGRHGLELLPVSRDAFQGPVIALDLAEIHLRTGDPDAALDLLESLPHTGFVTGHRLRLDPRWDALRDHPRFQRLQRSR
jgi:TolB-like protein/Flp pilus assembly protein TadD